ncbi:uncharacterized protein (DUF1800 family) [Actinoplanes octamycinicus]|uniref:Uncharacterized protein (DUF1800 family) n=1 Tax=Actinoplanes octamycinicus TaxID=135948 RepID=A0A7W7M8T8_9ACTN|nr:DUF1800 domain-containing protein [Actinoplanes octamycinicus]MBB4741165.1 uncharacterized protein (DUF1800 family) [Actinoplanes octamycinicus]GIE56072.1 hypothetical protein Aoc01nite_14740 [Actinoplanes octamycinicus]
MTERAEVSHLLRRLTFGPTAAEVDAAVRAGRDATLRTLLRPAGPVTGPDLGEPRQDAAGQEAKKQRKDQAATATSWWLRQLATGGAAEKLTFFWHGHWATSVRKVKSAPLMLGQLATFRRYGHGDTGALVRAMLRDPALILWLDGQRNTRKAPNENLAREVMELFTLGIGAYTEDDVKAGARVLTGWQVDRAAGTARLAPKRHDGRPVTLLGRTGTVDLDGYADLLVRHPAHVPFLVRRLWVRYAAGAGPSPAAAARIAGAGRDTTALLTALGTDPEFAATSGTLVKQPVEWLLGAVRQLGVPVPEQAIGMLRGLGQLPLRPPSVGGWPVDRAWLTTSATVARLRAAQRLVASAPAAVDQVTDPEALAHLLVVDTWTDRTHAVLREVKDPKRLLALGLVSPEYTVH